MPVTEIIPLALTAILASMPVALAATPILASALCARALAKLGVLTTRLSAVYEAASMDVLCANRIGTLTYAMHMDLNTLRTLAFVAIVLGNQATTYNNRERRRLWSSRPSNWVLASPGLDILIAATLPLTGIAMSPLPIPILAGMLAGAAASAVAINFVKVPDFRRLAIT